MLYSFINSKGTIQDVYYPMKQAPAIGSTIVLDGETWTRVLHSPHLATNGLAPIDPYSQKAFRDKTGTKGDTLGALWDRSAELSARRAEKEGKDPVKQKYYDDYAKQKKGRRHLNEKKENHDAAIKDLNTKLKKFDVNIGPIV